jgi:hypothetical protein
VHVEIRDRTKVGNERDTLLSEPMERSALTRLIRRDVIRSIGAVIVAILALGLLAVAIELTQGSCLRGDIPTNRQVTFIAPM